MEQGDARDSNKGLRMEQRMLCKSSKGVEVEQTEFHPFREICPSSVCHHWLTGKKYVMFLLWEVGWGSYAAGYLEVNRQRAMWAQILESEEDDGFLSYLLDLYNEQHLLDD